MDQLSQDQLAAYLARIGLTAAPAHDLGGIEALQRAHRRAIPFENLDIRLGRGVSLDPAAVFAKLVTHRRGGYCFEHNSLFARVLATLGFVVRPVLGRVWLRAEGQVPPRTHHLNLVHWAGADWIVDAGFGAGEAPLLRLAEGEEVSSNGIRHHLSRDADHGWMLMRGDVRQYSFIPAQVWPADLAQSNHWCMTAPDSRFVRSIILSRLGDDGLVALSDTHLSRDGATIEIADAVGYRTVLAEEFGLALSDAEVCALGLFEA